MQASTPFPAGSNGTAINDRRLFPDPSKKAVKGWGGGTGTRMKVTFRPAARKMLDPGAEKIKNKNKNKKINEEKEKKRKKKRQEVCLIPFTMTSRLRRVRPIMKLTLLATAMRFLGPKDYGRGSKAQLTPYSGRGQSSCASCSLVS